MQAEGTTPKIFRNILLRSVAWPLGVTVVLAAVFLAQVAQIAVTADWLDRAEIVIGRADRVRSLLGELELGRRGYRLTGDHEFLRLHDQASGRIQGAISDLTWLTSDNPNQRHCTEEMRAAFAQWGQFTQAERELSARADGRADQAADDEARAIVAAIHERVSTLLRTEESTRAKRSEAVRRSTWVVTVSSISLALLLGGAISLSARRQLCQVSEAYEKAMAAQRDHAEALRRSEERFESVFRDAAIGMALVTMEGRFLTTNRAYQAITGYTDEELRALTFQELTHPDDLEWNLRQSQLLIEGAIPSYVIEKRYVRKDGAIVWVQNSIVLGRNARGGPARLIALCQDITERKRATDALRESEWFNRSLLDSLSAQIAVLDERGTISVVNQAWRNFASQNGSQDPVRITGTDYLAVCDQAAADGVVGAAAFAAGIRDVLAGNREQFLLEYPRHTPDRPRWFLNKVQRFVGDGPPRVVVLQVDITDRKQAEAERERFFRLSLDAYVVVALDGTLRRVNPATERLAGRPAEEIEGHSFAEFIHPDDVPASSAALQGLAAGVPIADFETRCLNGDGTYRCISWTAVPIVEEGVAFAVGHDMTDRKLAEAEVRQLNAQLERRLERLAALRRIDTAITASLDMRLTLGVVLEQVLAQLQADAACVLLANPHTLSLEYAVGRGFRGEGIARTRLRLGEQTAGRAALERRLIGISDVSLSSDGLARTPLVAGEEFVAYHAIPLVAKGQVRGVLEVYHRRPFDADHEWLDFLEALAGQAAIAIENGSLFEDLQRTNLELTLAYDATIEGWSRALDLRDKETEGHSQRVTDMTLRLARAMGVSGSELVHVRRGALLHDIGKMGIPDRILLKPGPLSDQEWQVMRRHPAYAFAMLSPIAFLRPALDIPYCHHEKWDGTGYPRGLKGEQIPLAARVFAAVDVWDALRSDRPYRKGWPEDRVREHLRSLSGTHLDPEVVETLLAQLGEPGSVSHPLDVPSTTAECRSIAGPDDTGPFAEAEETPASPRPESSSDEPLEDSQPTEEWVSGTRVSTPILIADDDEASARSLRRILESMGYAVLSASDGEQAWRLLEANDVRVVISDWVMPGGDGPELCRRIRSRENRPYVFVILLTGRGRSEDRLEGLRAGADDFLTKPLDARELTARLGIAERITAMQEELLSRSRDVDRLYAEMLRQNEELAALVTADGLTGLKNIRGFREALHEAFSFTTRQNLPLSVVMIDVDRFKQYNDTFGHPAGDEVLCGIATVLRENARTCDVVARYGGEEFALVLSGSDADDALSFAERLRRAISERLWPRRAITASFGVATMSEHTLEVTELVNQADQALYHSKRQGRDLVSHYRQLEPSPSRPRQVTV